MADWLIGSYVRSPQQCSYSGQSANNDIADRQVSVYAGAMLTILSTSNVQNVSKQAVICVGVILGGCATSASSDRAEMTRIEQKCGLQKGTFQLDKKIGFKFNLDPNEKYEKAQCALSELRSSKLWRHIKIGFVGAEAPPPGTRE